MTHAGGESQFLLSSPFTDKVPITHPECESLAIIGSR
jgi:hypothetical protein